MCITTVNLIRNMTCQYCLKQSRAIRGIVLKRTIDGVSSAVNALDRSSSLPLIRKNSVKIYIENLCKYSSKPSTHHGSI